MWGFHLGEWCMEGYLPQDGRNIYFIASNNIWGNFIVLRTLFCHLGEIVTVFKWKTTGYIFFNCATKSYKLSGLKKCQFICLQFGRPKVWAWCDCVLCSGSQEVKSKCELGWIPIWSPESSSMLSWLLEECLYLWMFNRGPWFHPDYWLGLALSFEAALNFCHMTFSILKGSTGKSLISVLSDSKKGHFPFKDLPN